MEELVVTAKWRHLAPIVAPNGAIWRTDGAKWRQILANGSIRQNGAKLAPFGAKNGAIWRHVAPNGEQSQPPFAKIWRHLANWRCGEGNEAESG